MQNRPLALALCLGLTAAARAEPAPSPSPQQSSAGLYCSGDYADDLAALSPAARDFDRAQPPFTFCIRATATYECPSYAPDGSLRRSRRKVVAHGTGFGLRSQGGETVIATNDHVSEWPAVTDADNVVEDVPPGCKRIRSGLRIVDDEADAYERDDVALTRIVTDPELDVSLLRAGATLPIVPWKLGRSAGLRERNVVDVRGFPLGVLRAHNVGKVVSTYDRDEDHGWSHDDFVVDALLSPGNSGSPVLAVSCKTGELELVGIYHARYVNGGALHEVIAIDQLRDMLTTLKRTPRERPEAALAPLDAAARQRFQAGVRANPQAFFPFGAVSAGVHVRSDGALLFELMDRDFPVRAHPALVIEDLVAEGTGFGRMGRVWAGNRQGLRAASVSSLDAETHALLAKGLDALRRDWLAALEYRDAARSGNQTREGFQRVKRLERALRATAAARGDLAQSLLETSEQLCPKFSDAPATLADALAVPAPRPSPPPEPEPWRPVDLKPAEVSGATPIPVAMPSSR